MRVDATTNEHEAAPEIARRPPLRGAVITADVFAIILAQNGDSVLYAKDSQSRLRAEVEAAFTGTEGGDYPPG